eukprot:scaffold14246_cov105-Isochrysis_galbana.AAC.17
MSSSSAQAIVAESSRPRAVVIAAEAALPRPTPSGALVCVLVVPLHKTHCIGRTRRLEGGILAKAGPNRTLCEKQVKGNT